jgi:hypothetical protein
MIVPEGQNEASDAGYCMEYVRKKRPARRGGVILSWMYAALDVRTLVVLARPRDMPRTTTNSLPTHLLLVAAGALLLPVSPASARTDFNGNWELDLRASSSPDAVLKRLGASWVERQFGGSLKLQATYIQTPHLLTVDLRGLGFRRTDKLPIDNKPQSQEDSLLGRYTIRTYWSGNGAQLVSAVSLHTKDKRDAQVTIVRELSDGGKTLVLSGTLKVVGESASWTLRRVWRRRAS